MKAINKLNMSAISPHSSQWEEINWGKVNRYVKRLRQRIFRAEQQGQKRKARKLQRLMLRSKANLMISVKKITQVNKGKKTAGIDGYTVLNSKERALLYNEMCSKNIKLVTAVPVRRIYIPKKNKKLRMLGIPVIKDRIYQNVVKNALEPQWEAKFEPMMFGFRPKRCTHDALSHLHNKLNSRSTRKWTFEGDFKGCFDNLSHPYIMQCIEGFPAKEIIYKWLKAGYVDNQVFNQTEFGVPQGGCISPLLANIALNGMSEEIGVKYKIDRNNHVLDRKSVGTAIFADDFVIICHTKEEAESMFEKLTPYLCKRGLSLAMDKTKVTNIEDGFDFLGFNLKQYNTKDGKKLLIKPSKSSIKKSKEKIRNIFKEMRGVSVGELITRLNPVIRGIGNYWSSEVSKKTFNEIDHYLWIKVKKHLKHMYPKKSWTWRINNCFKPDHTGASKDNSILTDPKDSTNQLIKMKWIPIKRHTPIKYKNCPDNPKLKQYFDERDKNEFCRFNVMSMRKIAKRSKYKCRICNQTLVGEEKLKINYIIPKKLGGVSKYSNLELLHKSCYKQHLHLLIKYGGGKDFPKIIEFIRKNDIELISEKGINKFKTQFKKFKYTVVRDK
jgi:RNA-directed DNA polymerase